MREIDFLPERIRLLRARRLNLICKAYLATLFIAGLVATGYVLDARVDKAKQELGEFNSCLTEVQRLVDKRSSLEVELVGLYIKENISRDLGSRIDVTDLLAELETVLPKAMTLKAVKLEAVKIQVKAKRPGGINMARRPSVTMGSVPKEHTFSRFRLLITGLAPDAIEVANFIGQLSASPLFEDVTMGYSSDAIFRGRSAREFQAMCYVTR